MNHNMPPVVTCPNCYLTYYQTSAAHVCAEWHKGVKTMTTTTRDNDECAFIHKLVSGSVRCGALRQHHSQYTGHKFTEPTTTEHEPAARGEWRSVDMTDTAFDSRPVITIEQGDRLLATAYSPEVAATILRDHRLAALVPMMMVEFKFLRDTAFAFHVNEDHKPEAFAACEHHVCLRACETWNKVTAAIAKAHEQGGGTR